MFMVVDEIKLTDFSPALWDVLSCYGKNIDLTF